MPRYTIVEDTDLEITPDNWVVSLIIAKHHAAIVIEGIKEGKNFTKLCDFLPSDVPVPIGKWAYINYVKTDNPVVQGAVRVKGLNNPSHETLFSTLKDRYNDAQEMSIRTWLRNQQKANKLLENIETEEKNPPSYQASGNRQLLATAHNCITWALSKLELVDVKLSSGYYGSLQETCFATVPDDYTPASTPK